VFRVVPERLEALLISAELDMDKRGECCAKRNIQSYRKRKIKLAESAAFELVPLKGTETTTETTLPEQLPDMMELPEKLRTHEFKLAWDEWLKFRGDQGWRAYRGSYVKNRLLPRLAEWGAVAAASALRQSMDQCWQGVFWPRNIAEPQKGSGAPGEFDWLEARDAE
jgi:hypothetical protein